MASLDPPGGSAGALLPVLVFADPLVRLVGVSLFKLLPLHDWRRLALLALVSATFAGLVVLLPVPVLLTGVTGNLMGGPGPTLASFQAGVYCVLALIIFAEVYLSIIIVVVEESR